MPDNTNLNEEVTMVVEDAGVITTPIDDTLSISGAAADAKAVGDALDLKADKSEIQTQIRVNGQAADNQGLILVSGAEIPAQGDSDTESVAEALERVDGKTAEDIRMSSAAGAQTIAAAILAIGEQTAETIRMGGADSRTVKTAIDIMAANLSALAQTVDGLDEKTAADIHYMAGSTATIKEKFDALDQAAVRSVNGTGPDTAGDVEIRTVPYAENLSTEEMDQVDGEFLRRTSGGSGSLSDGDAWVLRIMGNRIHDGFVQERVQMTVLPMPRPVPAAITAVLDEATFEAYVGDAGTYTMSYGASGWNRDPALYGVNVSNDPVEGDAITIVWDGSSDAVMTVSAVSRTAPAAITATIDRDVFVAYVAESGTITLVYSTAWSADPALYGITVDGEPIAGDQIQVVYVKEVRGTIRVATPTRLVATGWNLYESAAGYARVCRYSETYGYKVSGTYTALSFAATASGEQTAITPDAGGLFQVPGDGYVFVDGGGSDTAIYTTWSDWTAGYEGSYEPYQESAVNIAGIMTQSFPYGLCRVGDVRDEINVNSKTAVRRIQRMAYSAENLASVKASGRAYEYDELYIYVVMASESTEAITIEEEYAVSEHGLEFFDGTSVGPYTEILYGQNLKDKLRRQVVAVTAQSFTAGQMSQARSNIGAAAASEVAGIRSGLTYVENGDTIAANANYTVGRFISWKGEIYRVKTTINATVTSGNWTTYLDKMDGMGGALSQINGDLASLNSKIANNGYVMAGASKTKSITISAGADATVNDTDYIIQGKTYIGTVVYSYAGANVSITCGYAGLAIGVRFNVHNFTSNELTIDIEYRHLYI